jgi:hypothetical protein
MGSSYQGNRQGTEKAGGTARPSHTKSHLPGHSPPAIHTVNVDFIRFKYVVLAKYLHMSIFEFYLLIKQHSLILCKNLLWLLF